MAIPPKSPILRPSPFLRLKEKMMREMYCTSAPKTNAMGTLKKIPIITCTALAELMHSSKLKPVSPRILMSVKANAAPSISNTSDTVVDVGIPKELNMSSSTMSVTITAM